MTFPAFLIQLKESNKPLFAATSIKISIESLEMLLKKTYLAGYNESDKFHENLRDLSKEKVDYNDLFGGIFGKK